MREVEPTPPEKTAENIWHGLISDGRVVWNMRHCSGPNMNSLLELKATDTQTVPYGDHASLFPADPLEK